MKVSIRPAIVALILGFPLFAIAATTAELQQQTVDLQNKVGQLQSQAAAVSPSACPLFGTTLKKGSSGDAVTRLQRFLARDPGVYPEAIVNGSYGPLTEAAVKRWQVKFKIVTSGTPDTSGFGAVGPRTVTAMISQCSGSTQVPVSAAPAVGGYMSVSPVAGYAPLLVSAQITVNTANVCGGATYTINYGDGTTPYQIFVPPNNCGQISQTLGHTYQNTGNFQLTLSSGVHSTFVTVTVAPR
ncbi:MAG: peptidoglycan-binding domain-containing protein [bacterium]|nr:peptidoglycan-binding domain-containing protein [bacterium]